MADTTPSPTELDEQPTAPASLTLESDKVTVKATLPEKYASDFFPIIAVLAVAGGPPAFFWAANTEPLPWWAAVSLGIAQVIGMILIAMYFRARPSDR